MTGWTGKVLEIDLSARQTRVRRLSSDECRFYIGGKGMAGYFLRPHVTRAWDDPRMPILWFTGPLVNTASPTSGRMCVMTRSPLTGTVGDCSVGGSLGTMLKRAGWDGIVMTGASDCLTGIEIEDDRCRFHDATSMAGWPVSRVMTDLPAEAARVVAGPAGENGVRFASLMIDGHYAAGRNGIGLALAARRVKYLTVAGTGRTSVADREALKGACEDVNRLISASPILAGELGIGQFGTGALYDLMDNRKMMPTANFRATRFAHAPRMNAWAYRQAYAPSHTGCRGCRIRCKQVDPQGRAIPEFETMSHFSALLENRDLETVMAANAICNDTGMDTIAAAAALACYAEVRGSALNPREILDLLADIAHGRGEGIALGAGSAAYAESAGVDASVSVKGQDLPAYDPRGAYGMALAYATSTRGACHLRAYPISHEILRKPVATDRFSFGGKARIIKLAEDANAVVDSLTACKFVFLGAGLEEYARVYSAVTGVSTTAQDLMHAGERIYYHERIMNAANGFAAADDDLPPRFFQEAGSGADGMSIPPLDREAFLTARANYYRIRGLDDNGRPLAQKAGELGLTWTD